MGYNPVARGNTVRHLPIGLPLEGLWSEHPLPDGVRLEEFGGERRVWLRGWLAAGDDRRVLGDRVLAALRATPVDWRVAVEGDAGPWPTRVIGGLAPDGWRVAHAVVELPWALVSLGCHEAEGELDDVVARCLAWVARLDVRALDARSERAGAWDGVDVDPARLVPWVLFAGRSRGGVHGAVRLDNGLLVAPAELRGPSVRLLAGDHPFWTTCAPAEALARAVLNLAGEIGRLRLERWALPNRAAYLVIGPHPCAPGAVLLPDLRAIVRGELGPIDVEVVFAGRDRLLVVPAAWPEDWRLSALGAADRGAPDLPLPGPLWRPTT